MDHTICEHRNCSKPGEWSTVVACDVFDSMSDPSELMTTKRFTEIHCDEHKPTEADYELNKHTEGFFTEVTGFEQVPVIDMRRQ
ncbi:hypothetical protein AB0I28_32910 [Phytomonospora sp. NPDC050363]|uniref:hypothetical protein n=1 Tax=Phytomonospora sp. NPDC050363 TaxID=3155642 RepID=UPI0033E3E23D